MTLVPAPMASSMAPVPRPPQPMRPIFTMKSSPPAAWTCGARRAVIAAAPATAEVWRKLRRETGEVGWVIWSRSLEFAWSKCEGICKLGRLLM